MCRSDRSRQNKKFFTHVIVSPWVHTARAGRRVSDSPQGRETLTTERACWSICLVWWGTQRQLILLFIEAMFRAEQKRFAVLFHAFRCKWLFRFLGQWMEPVEVCFGQAVPEIKNGSKLKQHWHKKVRTVSQKNVEENKSLHLLSSPYQNRPHFKSVMNNLGRIRK